MKKNLHSGFSAEKYCLLALLGIFLCSVTFKIAAQDYTNLKITEISYHPKDYIVGTDTTDGKDLEFIEFKNIGDDPILLTGLILDSAVYYEFPNDIQLAAKQFWVIASKPSKFLAFYGKEASGNFSGNLANSGDEILLKDASDNAVIHFIYDDHAPWPEEADGDGYTLVPTYINPTGEPGDEAYWRASYNLYGSPFSDDILTDIDNISQPVDEFVYPNPTNGLININNSQDIKDLIVFDIRGNQVYRKDYMEINQTIDLSGKPAGIYFVSFTMGDSVYNQKIILK